MSANNSSSLPNSHQERVLAVHLISENACLDNYFNLIVDKVYCAEILRSDGRIQKEYFRQRDAAACISLSRNIRTVTDSGIKNIKRDMGQIWGLPYRAPRIQDLLHLNPDLSNSVMINDLTRSPSSLSSTERSKLIQMRHEVIWNPARTLNVERKHGTILSGSKTLPDYTIYDPDNW